MPGSRRARTCHGCGAKVFDVADLTCAEAEELVGAPTRESTPWARFWRRADGTLIVGDCKVGRTWRRMRVAMAIIGGPILIAVFALALLALLSLFLLLGRAPRGML